MIGIITFTQIRCSPQQWQGMKGEERKGIQNILIKVILNFKNFNESLKIFILSLAISKPLVISWMFASLNRVYGVL